MLKKLIHIKNYGKFSNFNIASSDWDGTFKKNNVIYAPNGSGKTLLLEGYIKNLEEIFLIFPHFFTL